MKRKYSPIAGRLEVQATADACTSPDRLCLLEWSAVVSSLTSMRIAIRNIGKAKDTKSTLGKEIPKPEHVRRIRKPPWAFLPQPTLAKKKMDVNTSRL